MSKEKVITFILDGNYLLLTLRPPMLVFLNGHTFDRMKFMEK